MPAVIGMSGADGECPVQLLGGDDGGEFVGEGDAAEGEGAVGAGEGRGGPAVGGADGEDELLGAGVLKGAEGGGEVLGGELLAAAVGEEEDRAGAGGGVGDEIEEFGFSGEDVLRAGCVAGGAAEVAGQQLALQARG